MLCDQAGHRIHRCFFPKGARPTTAHNSVGSAPGPAWALLGQPASPARHAAPLVRTWHGPRPVMRRAPVRPSERAPVFLHRLGGDPGGRWVVTVEAHLCRDHRSEIATKT